MTWYRPGTMAELKAASRGRRPCRGSSQPAPTWLPPSRQGQDLRLPLGRAGQEPTARPLGSGGRRLQRSRGGRANAYRTQVNFSLACVTHRSWGAARESLCQILGLTEKGHCSAATETKALAPAFPEVGKMLSVFLKPLLHSRLAVY